MQHRQQTHPRQARGSANWLLAVGMAAAALAIFWWFAVPPQLISVPPPYGPSGPGGCSGGSPNSICEAANSENCATCPADCGPCDEPDTGCDNDGLCEPERDEGTYNCGDCLPVCGDQICAPDEVNTCQVDCTPHQTCGDGMCSAFEEFANCPLDCNPPSATPSLTLIPTRTPIPAVTLEEASPLPATSALEATEEPTTETNREPTATPTSTEEPEPTSTSTPTPANCRLVESDAMRADVVEALVEVTGGYRPVYWVICDTPPDEVCIPFDPVLAVPDANLDAMRLLDCVASGACAVFYATSLENGEICFQSASGRGQPLCAEGCSFARAPTQPVPPSSPSLILLLLMLLIAGAAILIILLLLMRRRREREHEEILDADLGTT